MRITSGLLLSASIALVTSAIAMPGVAAADPDALAGAGTGLTAPAGVVETPDGALWIADEASGVCRVALGAQPHLVASPWCGTEPAEEGPELPEPGDADAFPAAEPTPLGAPATAPTSVSGLVFDPQTDNFYVSDRASAGGSVWRLHYDRASGAIDGGTRIVSTLDRVQAVALAGDDVYYLTKRAGEIMRIADPAGTPSAPQLVVALGETDAEGMAATDDALYLADGGVKRLRLSGGAPPLETVAALDGLTVSAVAVDPARGRLYAGTSNPDLEDTVHVLDLATGTHEPYEQAFTSVTGVGVAADGALVVADDPTLASQATVWQARLWHVPVQPMGRPQVRVTARPAAVSAASGAAFAYASRDGASFECRLNGGAFAACPGRGTGEASYAGLTEGVHRFAVRAKDSLTGLYASVRFTLDRTAPTVTVFQPANDYLEGGDAPRVRFSAFENGVRYACSLDGGPFKECYSGNPIEGLSPGVHVLRVRGTDEAGNASAPNAAGASARISVLARWRAPVAQEPVAGPTASPAAARTGGSAPAPAAERKPLLFPFTLRVKDSPSSVRLLRFGLQAPGESVQLRVSVRNWRGRTVLTRVVAVRPNAHNRLDVSLTRAEQRRLRPGRYLVTAVLRTARGTEGNRQTHWLRVRAARR